jgi:hypothetical protein
MFAILVETLTAEHAKNIALLMPITSSSSYLIMERIICCEKKVTSFVERSSGLIMIGSAIIYNTP